MRNKIIPFLMVLFIATLAACTFQASGPGVGEPDLEEPEEELTESDNPLSGDWDYELIFTFDVSGGQDYTELGKVVYKGLFQVLPDGEIAGRGTAKTTGNFSCFIERRGDVDIYNSGEISAEFDFTLSGHLFDRDEELFRLVDLASGDNVDPDFIPLVDINTGSELAVLYAPQSRNPPKVDVGFDRNTCLEGLGSRLFFVADTIPMGLPNFISDFQKDDTGYYILFPMEIESPRPRNLQTYDIPFTATLTVSKKIED